MTSAFSLATDSLFNDPNLSVAATLWPRSAAVLSDWDNLSDLDSLALGDGDDGVDIRVVLRSGDQVMEIFDQDLVAGGRGVQIRVSDVAALTADDVIQVGDDYFTLTSTPKKDRRGLIWSASIDAGHRV